MFQEFLDYRKEDAMKLETETHGISTKFGELWQSFV